MTTEEKKKIKRLLREWGSFSKAIRAQNAEIAEFKKACMDIERVQNRGDECEIISIDSLKKQAKKLGSNIDLRMSLKTHMDEIIGDMSYDMQTVMRTRYIKGVSWELMPFNMPFSISERQCYRLHSQALEIIYNRYFCRDDDAHDIC